MEGCGGKPRHCIRSIASSMCCGPGMVGTSSTAQRSTWLSGGCAHAHAACGGAAFGSSGGSTHVIASAGLAFGSGRAEHGRRGHCGRCDCGASGGGLCEMWFTGVGAYLLCVVRPSSPACSERACCGGGYLQQRLAASVVAVG